MHMRMAINQHVDCPVHTCHMRSSAPCARARAQGYSSTALENGVARWYRGCFLSRAVSNSERALISHHCSVKCLDVLPYFRRLEKHPGSSILRSSQLFTHLPGPKLPNLETDDMGDCGRYTYLKSRVRRYIFGSLEQNS